MEQFMRKFMQLKGRIATVILEHKLFGKQTMKAQQVNIFEDEHRLGLILKGQAVYVFKEKLQSMELRDDVVEFSDDKLKILLKI